MNVLLESTLVVFAPKCKVNFLFNPRTKIKDKVVKKRKLPKLERSVPPSKEDWHFSYLSPPKPTLSL